MVLVLAWTTQYGIGPSLDYSIWYWSQPGLLNMVLVPAWTTHFGNLM